MTPVFILLVSLLYGTSSLFFRMLPVPLSGPVVVCIRGFFGALSILLHWRLLTKVGYRKGSVAIPPLPSGWLLVSTFAFSIATMLFFESLRTVPTLAAFTISVATPIYLIPLRYLVNRERPTLSHIVSAAVTLTGLVLTGWEISSEAYRGLVLAVASGMLSSLYFFAQESQPHEKRAGLTFWVAVAPAVLGLLVAPAYLSSKTTATAYSTKQLVLSVAIVALMAFVQYALPLVVWESSVGKVSQSFLSLMPLVAAVSSPFGPVLAGLETKPTLTQVCAALVVIVGAIVLGKLKRGTA